MADLFPLRVIYLAFLLVVPTVFFGHCVSGTVMFAFEKVDCYIPDRYSQIQILDNKQHFHTFETKYWFFEKVDNNWKALDIYTYECLATQAKLYRDESRRSDHKLKEYVKRAFLTGKFVPHSE